MSDAAPSAPARLDAPLPAALVGSGHGWLTRYRAWPVFSPPWARARLRTLGTLVGLAALTLGLLLLDGSPDVLPWGNLAQLAVQAFLPLVAGPWLGSWVRRQAWPAAREGWGLAAAVLAVVLAVLAYHAWAAEPVKQKLAELTGQVDEQGRRKRIVLAVAMTIGQPDEPRPSLVPAAGAPLPPEVRLMNTLSSIFISFTLAGGFALWGWRREQAGLAALAQAQALQQAQAARREAEMRLSVLAAQVEPHFLFNTLAGVRGAIASDPPRAMEMVDRLVEYLRAAIPRLRADGGAQATLGGQLEIVRAYLGLMAARMPRLRYEIDAPAELLAAPCPPLMLISLAENAVKHGAEPKIGPVTIRVQARRGDDGQLQLSVADNGAGFGASSGGSGLGLSNIRERLQQMYQGRASLTLKALPEGGVAATLSLPME